MGCTRVGKRKGARVTLRVTVRALSWANWEHGGALLRQGNQETFLTAPQLPQTPQHSAYSRPLLPILGPQRQASHQDVGDESHGCERETHRH